MEPADEMRRDRFAALTATERSFKALEPVIQSLVAAQFASNVSPLDRLAVTPGWERVSISNIAWMRVPSGWGVTSPEAGRVILFQPPPDGEDPRRQVDVQVKCYPTDPKLDPNELRESIAGSYRKAVEQADPSTRMTADGLSLRYEKEGSLYGVPVRHQRISRSVVMPEMTAGYHFTYTGRATPGSEAEIDEEDRMRRRMVEEIDAALLLATQLPGDPETPFH